MKETGINWDVWCNVFFPPQLVRMADDFDVEAMLEAPYKKVG